MPRSHLPIGALNVRVLSIVTAVVGLLTLVSAATPTLAVRILVLDEFISTLIRQDAAVAMAVLGFALLILASSLWRRKRSGWLLTQILLITAAALHLIKGLDYKQAIIALLLVGWLFTQRPEFHARSDGPSVRRGLVLLAFSVLFTLAYGTLGFTFLDGLFTHSPGLVNSLGQVVRLFYAPGTVAITPSTVFGTYFINSIYMIMLITVASALVLLSRSVIVREPATPGERERAKQIVETYGRSSIARMTLLEDKSYYFSPGGSVVAYLARNNFAVALGDPIGPSEDINAAITGFRSFAKSNGWQVGFYQVLPDHIELYQSSGLKALPIGQEAIVDLEAFTLSGRVRKSLRQHYNRIRDRGYRAVIHDPPIDDDVYFTLQEISDEWLTQTGGSEKRFSLGWFHEDYIRPVPIICVYDPAGEIVAFANILPEYQLQETTIDLMRHRSPMESGVMDFLFVSLFNWAKEQGYTSFNLGLVALAGVGDNPGDPAIERGIHYLFEHMNQVYNFRGLYDFKNKFQPEWTPRYLIHPGLVHLPGLALALVRADSGDDVIWTYLREIELRQLVNKRIARLRMHRATQ